MDNYLEERCKYVKSNYHKIKLSMINTGHLLSGEKLRIVLEYIDLIKISNYGFTKATYESVHGGTLKFEEVKQNTDRFLEICKGDGGGKPFTIMTFLDLPENHNELAEWQAYYEPRCNRIDIWKPHNWGGQTDISISESVKPCRRALDLSDLTFCADGSVSICCFDYNRKLIIGNIQKEHSLTKIINSDMTKAIQNVHLNGQMLHCDLICKHCDQIRDRTDALIYTNGNMAVGKNSFTSGNQNG
jgi:hypothetical protein